MSKANLGWLYYKEMYRNGDDVQQINNSLDQIFKASGNDESFNYEQSFKLKTTYPGLIIGSGYIHGLQNDEDSKIGFYFDHTSGFPTIPGSSVKGTLRSLFGFHTKKEKDTYQKEKEELIRDLTGKESLDVKLLVDDIFEGKDEKGDAKGIYNRDIFYEARVRNLHITDDYLAPHKEPLKNPIPIKFIKIAGGVTLEFSFKLHDGGGLSADEKLELFFQLLQLHGVGAKTNVGYGQFEKKELSEFNKEMKIQNKTLKKQKEDELNRIQHEKVQKKLEEELNNADTLVKKVALSIENMSDNKLIYDYLQSIEIEDNDKENVFNVVVKKIGNKPEDTPKNMKKAKTKWPIRIYQLFGK